MFLQSYFSSRSLMRELQKRRWFHDREGVLYGFALAFFVLLKVPLLGVLIYGIAEASTAYLITKITTPPPPPGQAAEEWKEKDTRWDNKHEFLDLPLDKMDKLNVKTRGKEEKPTESSGIATGKHHSRVFWHIDNKIIASNLDERGVGLAELPHMSFPAPRAAARSTVKRQTPIDRALLGLVAPHPPARRSRPRLLITTWTSSKVSSTSPTSSLASVYFLGSSPLPL
ncbi:hypothetical protein KC345_g289 [Hortaea werneckii]|nr:hypothetical protein KC345_g289 [Hortaea werneckii]